MERDEKEAVIMALQRALELCDESGSQLLRGDLAVSEDELEQKLVNLQEIENELESAMSLVESYL